MVQALERVAQNLRVLLQNLPSAPDLKGLREARSRLMDSYEHFLNSLRAVEPLTESALPASLRPRNYVRNGFHVLNALTGVALYQWVFDRHGCLLVLIAVLAVYATLDITRRLWPRWNEILFDSVFKQITRPRERHQIPAASWYALATFLVVLTSQQTTAQLAVLVLGIGDPAASLVGRKWGRRKLWRRKSLVGTGAFAIASFLAAAIFLTTLKALPWGRLLPMATVASVAGAAAEVVSDDRLDDNFTVPITVAAALGLFT